MNVNKNEADKNLSKTEKEGSDYKDSHGEKNSLQSDPEK